MKEKVYKVGYTWEYTQNPNEIEHENCIQSVEFDDLIYIAITDRVTKQVCILKKGSKFGVYTNDHTNGFGGPGTWCNPTANPFPYDEVKYSSFPWDKEYGIFAFRIVSPSTHGTPIHLLLSPPSTAASSRGEPASDVWNYCTFPIAK